MTEIYYRTGQAAKALGVSSYHVRRLCEAGVIAAEVSEEQQWKTPAGAVEQLKQDGVPPVPREVEARRVAKRPAASAVAVALDAGAGLYGELSGAVIEAAEEVKIVESRLQKRRLEREAKQWRR